MTNFVMDGASVENAFLKLKGRRLIVISDMEKGRKISAADIKRLTGADTLSGRAVNYHD